MSNQSRPVSPDGAATFEELAQFLDNADDRRAITNLEAILALGRKINQQSFSLKLKLKQEELESKDQLVVQSMRRVLAAEGALELQVVDGDALSTQLETKDAEIDKLKAWLEKIERDFELQVTDGVEERSRLENMKADNALFKAAFEMQTKGSVALHHQLEGKDAEIDSLKAQLEKTQEALELLGRDDIDLRGQLAGSDSKVASLKDGLDLQKKGSVALRRQIESRNAEVASLKARLEKKEEAFEVQVVDKVNFPARLRAETPETLCGGLGWRRYRPTFRTNRWSATRSTSNARRIWVPYTATQLPSKEIAQPPPQSTAEGKCDLKRRCRK